MTGQDARKPLDELNITKYLESSKELHALSDDEKLGFELDNILPLGTTGCEFLLISKMSLLKVSAGTKALASSMGF